MKQNDPVQSNQPVAYDQQGRPLYAHPPSGPQVVYMARPHEPQKPHLSEDVKAKHAESIKKYPLLNLSDGEYVVSAIKRHPIGLIGIWATTALLILMVCVFIPVILLSQGVLQSLGIGAETGVLGIFVLIALIALFLMGGYVAAYVYNANRFYLTNESVIQHIQTSLLAKNEQTISLANIEDASFRQIGLLQHFFGYGSLRLSTEGEETTYRFNYVSNPRRQIAILNDAVEAFKNGRPIKHIEDN